MNIEYSIEQEDLNIIKDTFFNRTNIKKNYKFLSTYILVTVFSFIIIFFTLLFFKIYSGFILNDTFTGLIKLLSLYKGFGFIISLIVVTIILTFGLFALFFFIPNLIRYSCIKKFNFLIDTFSIFIEKNTLILSSRTATFKVPLAKENIRIKNNTLFLFVEDTFLTIIPLKRVSDKEILLDNINKYIGVVEYDL